MLAHVAQEIQGGKANRPVIVVDHHGSVWSLAKVEESLQLLPDPVDPLVHDLDLVQGALPRLLRITDQTRSSADQRERAVPSQLEATNSEDLKEVAHMQTWGRRIEPAIERDGSGRRLLAKKF